MFPPETYVKDIHTFAEHKKHMFFRCFLYLVQICSSLPNISNINKEGTLGAVAALHSHHHGHHSPASSYMGSPSGSISIAEVRHSRPSIAGDFTIPDDDNSVFKPSTHVMRREDSALGTLATAAQLRHKELHVHHYDDED